MKRAAEYAAKECESALEKLRAAGMDANAIAPYPKYGRGDRIAEGYYQFVRKITEYDGERNRMRRHDSPEYVLESPKAVAKFIAAAKRSAADQYDAFVDKLVGKIGEVTSATLEGNHVWSYSILTVTKPDGTIEKWKTQGILNRSVLGLIFNQWPTRKVK